MLPLDLCKHSAESKCLACLFPCHIFEYKASQMVVLFKNVLNRLGVEREWMWLMVVKDTYCED